MRFGFGISMTGDAINSASTNIIIDWNICTPSVCSHPSVELIGMSKMTLRFVQVLTRPAQPHALWHQSQLLVDSCDVLSDDSKQTWSDECPNKAHHSRQGRDESVTVAARTLVHNAALLLRCRRGSSCSCHQDTLFQELFIHGPLSFRNLTLVLTPK